MESVEQASMNQGSAMQYSEDSDLDDMEDDMGENEEGKEDGVVQGRWTQEEHHAFLDLLKQYGRDWKRVAAKIKTRTSTQVRSHAQKYFAKRTRMNMGDVAVNGNGYEHQYVGVPAPHPDDDELARTEDMLNHMHKMMQALTERRQALLNSRSRPQSHSHAAPLSRYPPHPHMDPARLWSESGVKPGWGYPEESYLYPPRYEDGRFKLVDPKRLLQEPMAKSQLGMDGTARAISLPSVSDFLSAPRPPLSPHHLSAASIPMSWDTSTTDMEPLASPISRSSESQQSEERRGNGPMAGVTNSSDLWESELIAIQVLSSQKKDAWAPADSSLRFKKEGGEEVEEDEGEDQEEDGEAMDEQEEEERRGRVAAVRGGAQAEEGEKKRITKEQPTLDHQSFKKPRAV